VIAPELNDRLTRVGPDTPMGSLLRRYWFPVAASETIEREAVKKVRLLGEDLVLFRSGSGQLGLVAERCPHRGASLAYGFPDGDGLRCPYHGWLFGRDGTCLEQPNQFQDAPRLRDQCAVASYAAREYAGLIFAYLGPSPAPAIPPFDLFTQSEDRTFFRDIGWAVIDCNWLQIMENSLDPTHSEWLHGKLFDYHLRKSGGEPTQVLSGKHVKLGFDLFDHGIVKRRLRAGQSEDVDDWTVGHPSVFPNMLKVGGGELNSFQIRVPMDDEHTLHFWYCLYELPQEFSDVVAAVQRCDASYSVQLKHADGSYIMDIIDSQDAMVWTTQGARAHRQGEHLCQGDEGVAMFRKLLAEQLDVHEAGGLPMNVFDEAPASIALPMEHSERGLGGRHGNPMTTYLRTHAKYSVRVNEAVRLINEKLGKAPLEPTLRRG
jgi:5,5'-dehydrodivanillate O-demethylase